MGLWWWPAALFVLAVAAGIWWRKRDLAEQHSVLFGGTLGPGCVVVEAITLVLLAILLVVGHLRHWF